MPSFEELENPKSNLASEVYSSDGKLLGKYFIENRSNIHYQDLSPNVVNALIATEDARFEKHSGVDVKAIFRVFFGVFTGYFAREAAAPSPSSWPKTSSRGTRITAFFRACDHEIQGMGHCQ